MPDMTPIYGKPFNFIAFFGMFMHYWHPLLMSEVLNPHQTFTDCLTNQYTHILICQYVRCDCML